MVKKRILGSEKTSLAGPVFCIGINQYQAALCSVVPFPKKNYLARTTVFISIRQNFKRMLNYLEHISIDPNIRFGKPCIKGTRIAVADILQWLASGMAYEEILEDFPLLKKEDILAALAFAARREQITQIIAA